MEDETLRQKALEVQRHPPNSAERRHALSQLVRLIWISPDLGHPYRNVCPISLYEDIRNEAILRIMSEIPNRIDQYQPQYSVMQWVNGLLRYRLLDVWQEYKNAGITHAPRRGSQREPVIVRSLDQLQLDWAAEPSLSDSDEMRQFIAEDPEHRLNKHIGKYPTATLKFLFLAMLDGLTWDEIAKMFDPPIPKTTVCSFVHRNLRKLEPYFQKHLCE
jgi:DNA-directed RNA polymerase specialized sigma24 family protein